MNECPAFFIIFFATNSGFRSPCGFNFDLKGPRINFLIIRELLFSINNLLFFRLTSSPIRRFVISYTGLKAI